MSFIYEALRSTPRALFLMDDELPVSGGILRDYSGRGSIALASSPNQSVPVVAGATRSLVYGNSGSGGVALDAGFGSHPRKAFSVEIWFVKVGGTQGPRLLTSSSTDNFGLTCQGTVISFSTEYGEAGPLRASYDVQQHQVFHVVGTHSDRRNSLYINGELVSYVDITDEYPDDDYVVPTSSLITSDSYAINGVGAYEYELPPDRVKAHYEAGRAKASSGDVVGSNGGDLIPVSLENSDIFVDQMWQSDEDWSLGEFRNVVVESGSLVTGEVDGLSIEGDWTDNFILPDTVEPIYGVLVNWDGVGAIVEVSLDAENWEIATRGARVMTVPEGHVPNGEELHVRVSFAGGVENDESFIDNLNVIGLMTGESPEVAGRIVTQDKSSQGRDYLPLELHDNWGTRIETGGTVTISKDNTEEESPLRTLEMWVKDVGTSVPMPITGTVYTNGKAGNTNADGQWRLVHIVSSSDVLDDVTIAGPRRVGHVAIYPRELSADEISRIFSEYSDSDFVRVNNSGTVRITNVEDSAKIYAHDWSIHLSG